MAVNTDETLSEEPEGPDTYLAEDPDALHQPPDDTAILQELKDSESERKSTRMIARLPEGLDKVTFGVAGAFALGFVVWGLANTASLSAASNVALSWVTENTGWFFVSLASFFVVFVLWLALGRFGNIPLGRDGEKPEFRTVSWISMMFSAGMGIGLVFYGVAEPLYHYVSPPPGTVDGSTPEAIQTAMATSIFHWSIHPWAMFAVVGIAMAYSTFRLGRRQLISSAFTSLFGPRVEGPAGKIVNILAIFATLFGTAASLGLGAMQIASGIEFNGWVGHVASPVLVGVIAVLTACFVISAVSGISRGIQWLSNINMVLALLLAVLVFVLGPTLLILNLVPSAIGDFVRDLPSMASRTESAGDEAVREWMSGWTIFYWAWWVSWAPFVGMFIARISRGRTIRQFVTGVLLVPSLVSVIWFSIFGGAAFDVQLKAEASNGATGSMVDMVDGEPSIDFEGAMFDLIHHLGASPGVTLAIAILAMVLVGIFFVTGADSASIVMGSLSTNGRLEPSKRVIVFWGVLTGAVAAIMLLAGGDDPGEALNGLKNITIVSALPFAVVMFILCIALVKDLRRDPLALRKKLADSVVERAIRSGVDEHGGVPFELVTRHDCTDACASGDQCPGRGADS
ncbi:BCCT family transporter [Paeniglutamicibacter sp. ABSL32-1]|uniref:BCCT family transporter n=1 Tax=Paeniglutamicibacter quisquiliarum TaxID=2849498 RepID=UPI001C2CCD2C|nr:BCCT family transporter [Paeniglutamicibacter quisquiliarum]MBV1779319.1 BCCT family transporter [Paeniglutamicibacter quisquiliarum]